MASKAEKENNVAKKIFLKVKILPRVIPRLCRGLIGFDNSGDIRKPPGLSNPLKGYGSVLHAMPYVEKWAHSLSLHLLFYSSEFKAEFSTLSFYFQ